MPQFNGRKRGAPRVRSGRPPARFNAPPKAPPLASVRPSALLLGWGGARFRAALPAVVLGRSGPVGRPRAWRFPAAVL